MIIMHMSRKNDYISKNLIKIYEKHKNNSQNLKKFSNEATGKIWAFLCLRFF